MAEPTTVDEYMATLPDDRRGPMNELREAIRAGAPEATEVISYKMPAFRSHGQFLVSYDAFKQHYSLFPWNDEMVAELGDEIRPYVKGRGTLQFPASKPLPLDLIRRIIEIRVRQSEPGGGG